MLLCKGHMGSEDVLKPGVVMADWTEVASGSSRRPTDRWLPFCCPRNT